MAEASLAVEGLKRPYLTFVSSGRRYALRAEDIREVIVAPNAARVPLAPPALIGLANYRGEVLPVVSLRRLLGLDEAGAAGARAIVFGGGLPAALVVDTVESLVSVSDDRLASAQAELAAELGEILAGAFQSASQDAVKILDIQALLALVFARNEKRRAPAVVRLGVAAATPTTRVGAKPDKLITFEVAGQEYALFLSDVEQVMPVPDLTTPIPRAEALVVGVMNYRDQLLPLLSLRGLLGFPQSSTLERRERVIVAAVRGVAVGLVVDRAREIVSAEPEALEAVPAVLAARSGGETRLKAIYRGDGGKRIIAILSPELLFAEDVMKRLDSLRSAAQVRPAVAPRLERQFVVFQLGGEEFGLPVEAVDEVAKVPAKLTPVPNAPAFLEGVVNLRGELLPVVDQRRRFDMPRNEGAKDRRLIVVRTNGRRAGLIVDAVSEVRRCEEDAIEPAPDLTSDLSRLVRGVLNLAALGRIVMLLDPLELLTGAEQRSLDSLGTQQMAPE
jgi:purine-binding chemotaxis protein CheW